MKNFVIAISIVFAMTSCDRTDSQPIRASTIEQPELPNPSEHEHASNTISIPSRFVFSPSLTISRAASWDSHLLSFTSQEQALLRSVSSRYYETVKFHSYEEQLKLAQSGFPMPEEWIAASSLTDEELKRRADSGNIKAQMFYSDRLASHLADIQSAHHPGVATDEKQKELVQLAGPALGSGAKLMRSSDSPFAAYVYGRILSGSTLGIRPEAMAGSYFAARDRGDTRAQNLMAIFARENPGMNNQTIMAAYSAMTASASR